MNDKTNDSNHGKLETGCSLTEGSNHRSLPGTEPELTSSSSSEEDAWNAPGAAEERLRLDFRLDSLSLLVVEDRCDFGRSEERSPLSLNCELDDMVDMLLSFWLYLLL